MYVYVYIYIYIERERERYTLVIRIIHVYILSPPWPRPLSTPVVVQTVMATPTFGGNHLSDTTCLTQALFKRGEECSKVWCSLTRRNTHKTNEAALDK